MSPRQIDHHLLDENLTVAEISRRLKKQYDFSISSSYVSLILHGERTGFKYRAAIAQICRLKVKDIPVPPKKSDRANAAA